MNNSSGFIDKIRKDLILPMSQARRGKNCYAALRRAFMLPVL